MKSLNSSPNQHGDFVREGFVGECPPMTNTKTWKMHSSKKKQKRTLRPRGLKGSQKIYSGSEILRKKKSKKKESS